MQVCSELPSPRARGLLVQHRPGERRQERVPRCPGHRGVWHRVQVAGGGGSATFSRQAGAGNAEHKDGRARGNQRWMSIDRTCSLLRSSPLLSQRRRAAA